MEDHPMRYPPTKKKETEVLEELDAPKGKGYPDKPPLKSKKFLAYLYAETGFFALLGIILMKQGVDSVGENMAFMILAITAGFLASAYVGGQALVDRYVKVALSTMGKNPDEK